MKRLLSIIIAALFALTVFPFAALGDGENQEPIKLPYAYVGTEYHAIAIGSYYSGIAFCSDFRIKEGALPQGLKMTTELFEDHSQADTTLSYNVNIEGTPTEKGYFEFVIAFRDGNLNKEVEYPVCIYVVDAYSIVPYASMDRDYEETVLTIDEADTYELTKGTMLPAGIEIADKTGEGAKKDILLKGKAEEKGDFIIGIDVKSGKETATYIYKLTVRDERVHLVKGFIGEIYKDTLFEHPEAEFSTEDTLPKGLIVERTEKTVGEEKTNVFEIKGVPEEAGEFVIHAKFTKGDEEIFAETYVVNIEKEFRPELYPFYSCVYGEYDETELFFSPADYKLLNVYGNLPKGLEVKVVQEGFRHTCMMVGTPEEKMTGRYIFEVEFEKTENYPQRELCVLYIADKRIETETMHMSKPLEVTIGSDIEGLQSMELLMNVWCVTFEKNEQGYTIKINIDKLSLDGLELLLPVLVKYTDKDTGETVETIIQYKIKVEVVLGDSNSDGEVNTADATEILKYSAGMTGADMGFTVASDVNKDNEINTADAVVILKYAAGMIGSL